MSLFLEYLGLFGASLGALLAMSIAAPPLGAFLHARGTALHGLALPQAALAGIAVGALIEALGHDHGYGYGHVGHGHGPSLAADFLWASAGTAIGLAVLSARWRAGGSDSGRAAALFCVASAAAVLLPSFAPTGALQLDSRTRGEILAIGTLDLTVVLIATAGVALVLARTWRAVLLVGQDPLAARVRGLSIGRTNAVLYGCVAAITVVGTATTGPLAVFGLLVLPALGCHAGARSMASFLVRSIAVGVFGAALAVAGSFAADLPLGPCVIVGAAAAALAARLVWRAGEPLSPSCPTR